jgi:PEP-CTERM motif-containing protein
MMKKLGAAVSLALSAGLAGLAYGAVPVTIDPDAGGAATPISVGNLDWAAGNAIAVGAGADPAIGTTFQTYAQARLAQFNDSANNPYTVTGFGAGGFEWTYVTSFTEVVTKNDTTGGLGFALNPSGGGLSATNFFQIYVSAANSSDLAGTGFNDGTLILTGHIVNTGVIVGDSLFQVSIGAGGVIIGDLDASPNGNDYPNIDSVQGSGSSKITVAVDSFNSSYFQGLTVGSLLQLDFTTNQTLAYNQTDPSACFADAGFAGGAGNGGTCANTIGAVNGISTNNIMFQTDAISNFSVTTVPEPGVLALLGISLLGLGVIRKRAA